MKAGPGHRVRKANWKKASIRTWEFECRKWSEPEGTEALGAVPGTEN